MSPTLQRGLITLAAIAVAGIPQAFVVPALVGQGCVLLSGILMGWAHTSKPGDVALKPVAADPVKDGPL